MANYKPMLTAGRFPRVVTVVKRAAVVERGGPGSGHFGHRGRPGDIGGSMPGDFHAAPGKRIVKVISVVDTREYVEMEDGKWHPVVGSGTEHVCQRCGKFHEVHATVECEDGSQMVVGTACAKQEFSEAARKQLGRKDNASKRLKALVAKREKGLAEQKAWDDALALVMQKPAPEPVVTPQSSETRPGGRLDRAEIRIGDAAVTAFATNGVPDPAQLKERIQQATQRYYQKRVEELGFPSTRPWFDAYENQKAIDRAKATLEEGMPDVVERGGPGSGHHGHEGRPGEIGGSQPGDFHSGESAAGGGETAKKPAAEEGGGEKAGANAPAKHGLFPEGLEPAKGDTPEARQDKLERLKWLGLGDLPDAVLEEAKRITDKYSFEIIARERNILAQYSALHKALAQNLAGKGASEEDAGKRATAILKENMPELSDAAVETVRTLRTMESNVQASHAKAEELGYENYYVNQYTGEPIPISNPDDEIFSGREKATFNMKLAGAMDTHNVRDPNDLTLGQIRQAFAGTPLEDKINSLYPAEQSGKKIGEYAAEEEAKVEKKSLVGRGGPGSGHRGHKGRPGERGGSLPSGGGASPLKRNFTKRPHWKEGFNVQFTNDEGRQTSWAWYKTLEAAQADIDEWMATGGIVPKPGDFHSGMPNKRIKVETLELSRAQRNFLLREMGGSTEFDYPELWEQLRAGNTITGAEVLDDLYTHVEGVIDRVDYGDKDPQAYRDRTKARTIIEAMETAPKPGDFHSAPSKGVKRYRVGTLNGEKVEIVHRPRTSVADASESQDYLIHGDRIYPLDTDRMMFKTLRDLLPVGYMTPRVTVKDWEPFIDEANRRGHHLPIDFHSAHPGAPGGGKFTGWGDDLESGYLGTGLLDNRKGYEPLSRTMRVSPSKRPEGWRVALVSGGTDRMKKEWREVYPTLDEAKAAAESLMRWESNDMPVPSRMPLSKANIGKVLQWSTSRYNDYSKEQAVDIAHRVLVEGKGRQILSTGSYTPATAMTGSDYLVNGPEGYIAVGSGGTQQLGEEGIEGFKEFKRHYFPASKPSIAKSLVARYSRRLVGK